MDTKVLADATKFVADYEGDKALADALYHETGYRRFVMRALTIILNVCLDIAKRI